MEYLPSLTSPDLQLSGCFGLTVSVSSRVCVSLHGATHRSLIRALKGPETIHLVELTHSMKHIDWGATTTGTTPVQDQGDEGTRRGAEGLGSTHRCPGTSCVDACTTGGQEYNTDVQGRSS
eukprot:43884-Eustigmatos_ZCMA.PRE.1